MLHNRIAYMGIYNIGNDHKQPLYLYDQRSFCDGIFTRFNTVYFEARDNKKINHLTHGWVTSLVYEDYDYAYAYEFLKEKYYPLYASCSSVQKGNIRGRNYDWTYDYQPTFIIRTPADHGRHATIGIAAGQGDITRCVANSKTPSEYYKILPFRIVDGINDAGLLVNVNVCQIYNDAGELDITNITDKEEPAIPALMFTRYILDYCSTIGDVINVVNKRNFFMANSEALVEEFHYMITDKTGKTVVIEFKDNEPVVIESNFMTNYKLCGDTGVDYGAGHERADIINSKYDDISDAESMLDVMKSVWYTNAYKSFIEDRDVKWLSECNGKTLLPSGEIADLHQGLPEEDYTDIVNGMIYLYNNRSRDTGYTWQTVHTSVYDATNSKLILIVQENDNYRIELSFDDIYQFKPETGEIDIGGLTYKTVKIGNKWWLAENLQLKQTFDSDISVSYFYNDNEEKYGRNGLNYGRLYSYKATDSLDIPEGWRIPSKADWEDLLSNANQNISDLKADYGWNGKEGTNVLKFSVLPGGRHFSSEYRGELEYGDFWTSTEYASENDIAQRYYIRFDKDNTYKFENTAEDYTMLSLRLVKDDTPEPENLYDLVDSDGDDLVDSDGDDLVVFDY